VGRFEEVLIGMDDLQQLSGTPIMLAFLSKEKRVEVA
jgi:hypothetical protein